MSATTLKKPDLPAGYPAATKFFEQLTTLFAAAPAKKPKSITPKKLEASVNTLRNAPADELEVVRAVLSQMSAQIDRLRESGVTNDEWKAAEKEDTKVKNILAAARSRAPSPVKGEPSPESANFMAEMRSGSAAALQRSIARKDLLPSKEFQDALKVSRQSVSDAVKTGRMFALVGPSGENYYPAFYADPDLDRRAVEKVSKVLGTLPGASKYFFFTSKSVFLGAQTPVDALKSGRLADVLVAAAGFAAYSAPNWTPIPRQTGHLVQRKLDTDSTANWTPVPLQTGQFEAA